MKNTLLSSGAFWFALFLAVQVLAFFVIFGNDSSISPILGFPNWLIYFIGVELLFSLAFYFFIENYWAVEESEID